MSWADAAAPIIAEVVRRLGRSNMTELEAYPWSEREATVTGAPLASQDEMSDAVPPRRQTD